MLAQELKELQNLYLQFANNPTRSNRRAILERQSTVELPTHLSFSEWLLVQCGENNETKKTVLKLKEVIDKLSSPPWYQAILLKVHPQNGSPERALVALNGKRVEVSIADGVDSSTLRVGDVVVMNQDCNALLDTRGAFHFGGDIASLDRVLTDGRLVLIHRGNDELIVQPATQLESNQLKPGNKLRFDFDSRLAYEVIDDENTGEFLDTVDETSSFSDIGGLKEQIESLKHIMFWPQKYGSLFKDYLLTVPKGVLLTGPPGVGKTMLGRAATCELLKLYTADSDKTFDMRKHFQYIKGPQIFDMWLGNSEKAVRDIFRRAIDVSTSTGLPSVIFWDEFEATFPIRGSRSGSSIDTTVVPMLLSEMDGLSSCEGNVIVIAATNRIDAIDPAVLRPGRFDYIIDIPRPGRDAAADIFSKYITDGIRLDIQPNNGSSPAQEAIESVVSYIYSQREDQPLATLMFRDGARRPVNSHELFSGAIARNIVRKASMSALVREVHMKESESIPASISGVSIELDTNAGVRIDDLFHAADNEFNSIANILTAKNARSYIKLPEDNDVVSVECHSTADSSYKYLQQISGTSNA